MEMDLTARVLALYASSDSAGESFAGPSWKRQSNHSTGEFGGIFREACDELKKESGTHQNREFVPTYGRGIILGRAM